MYGVAVADGRATTVATSNKSLLAGSTSPIAVQAASKTINPMVSKKISDFIRYLLWVTAVIIPTGGVIFSPVQWHITYEIPLCFFCPFAPLHQKNRSTSANRRCKKVRSTLFWVSARATA